MALSTADIAALSRLLDQALDLRPADRAAWLDALPPDAQPFVPALRQMLEEVTEPAGTRLATLPQLPDLAAVHPLDGHPGDRVGPYRLRQEIGRGGMGSVWLAERADGIFAREVALKLPQLSLSPRLAERMARERQIGALLEHPNIARLYDAGIDDKGRPYLVMERVHGVDLLAHCRQRELDRDARIRLFLQVCEAVAHAHRQLVVHRDLKPSNLLVDESGQVKLLDFGIARLLGQDGEGGGTAGDGSLQTHTPRYAAPEQVRGVAVTTATDIYSLGAILFELLTGEMPRDALARGEDPGRSLGPDLWPVLRCALREQPAERYSSVERLADDLRRVQQHRPVRAAPVPWAHRARLFVRRHRLALAAGAAAAVLIVGSGAAVLEQRARQQQQAERATQATEFLLDLLRETEPMEGQSAGDITAERMVRSALARARQGVGGDAVLRGQVLMHIGVLLRRIDTPAESLGVLREAMVLIDGHAEPDDPARHVARAQLANGLMLTGALDEAGAEAGTVLASCARPIPRCAMARAWAQAALARVAVARGDSDAAILHSQAEVRENDLAFGPAHAEAALARANLATVLRNAGRLPEAAQALEEALAIAARTSLRAGDRLQMQWMSAAVQADLGQHELAVGQLHALLAEPEAAAQRPLLQRLLAQSLLAQGRLDAAAAAAGAAQDAAIQAGDDWETAFAQQTAARVQSLLGRHDAARAAIEAAIAGMQQQGLAPASLQLLRARRIAGELALRAGRLDEARRRLEPLVAAYRADDPSRPRAPIDLAQTLDLLGALARRDGAWDAAAARHTEAAALLAGALPESHLLRRANALQAALAQSLRDGGTTPALGAAAQRFLNELPADSAWRSIVQPLPADPGRGRSLVF